jgi:hypothetical protein
MFGGNPFSWLTCKQMNTLTVPLNLRNTCTGNGPNRTEPGGTKYSKFLADGVERKVPKPEDCRKLITERMVPTMEYGLKGHILASG